MCIRDRLNKAESIVKKSEINLEEFKKDLIVKSAELLEITVLDHIIVGQNSYFSFADENTL